MINVVDISSVYNNLICPRSKLQENIEYMSIEDDDYDKKTMKIMEMENTDIGIGLNKNIDGTRDIKSNKFNDNESKQ